MPVRLEPPPSGSRVKHSTNEPLNSLHYAYDTLSVDVLKAVLASCYSKTCLKWPLKNRQNKVLKKNDSLMKVERIAECSFEAFCNTFDLH